MGGVLWRWGPLAGYAAGLLALSAHPRPPGAGIANDKLLHGLAYAVFAVLAWRAARGWFPGAMPGAALTCLALVAAHGAAVELCQRAVPGRHASVWDFVADVVGGGLAMAVLMAGSRRGSPDPPMEA